MAAYVMGHKNPDTDSIVSAIACACFEKARGIDAVAVAQGRPTPESAFVLKRFGLNAPEVVDSVAGKDLYLVDFSDLAQAPADIKEANVKGIVDHHKLGDVTTASPLEAVIFPVGCTCTVLERMFAYAGIAIPADIAGAMLCAILSDTVIFKSPTTTDFDRQSAGRLAQIAGVADCQALGMELFAAKSAVAGTPVRDLVLRDFKDFVMGGRKIGVGQLELVSLDLVKDVKAALLEDLAKLKGEGARHSVLLLLTDIMKEGSELLLVSDEPEKVASAFGKDAADLARGNLWLEGVMSRKKQVVPNLERTFG